MLYSGLNKSYELKHNKWNSLSCPSSSYLLFNFWPGGFGDWTDYIVKMFENVPARFEIMVDFSKEAVDVRIDRFDHSIGYWMKLWKKLFSTIEMFRVNFGIYSKWPRFSNYIQAINARKW